MYNLHVISDINKLTMFSLNDTILLRGVRTSGEVDNATISTKSTERGLYKLHSIIDTKNLRHREILSYNLRDKVRDCRDNLNAIIEKADPTYTSVVIKKHDIVAMTQNRGGYEKDLEHHNEEDQKVQKRGCHRD